MSLAASIDMLLVEICSPVSATSAADTGKVINRIRIAMITKVKIAE